MADLSLVSIDELIDEVERRNDACIIAYIKTLDSKMEDAQFCYHGGKFTALGLARGMAYKLERDLGMDEKDDE